MSPQSHAGPEPRNPWRVPPWQGVAAAAYVLLLAVTLARHEMWRDELHPWLLARALGHVPNLFTSPHFGSYPWLWPNLLVALSSVTPHPAALQVLNGIISVLAALLVLRWAPFPPWARVGLIFGYFFLYEYAAISRNYMAGVLFALAFCTVWGAALPPGRKRWLLALCLVLLSGTSLYGNLLTGALALQWAGGELGQAWRRWRTGQAAGLAGRALPLAAVGAAMLVSVAQTYVASMPYRDVWNPQVSDRGVLNLASLFSRALLPLPPWRLDFWNNTVGSLDAKLLLTVLLLAAALLLLSQWPRLLWLCFLPGLAVLNTVFVMYHPVARHYGHLALLVLCVVWLAAREPRWVSPRPWLRHGSARLWRWRKPLAGVVLAVQVAGAAVALGQDWRFPFSGAQSTAAAIRAAGLGAGPFAGDRDWPALPVSGFLGQPFYYPRTGFEAPYLQAPAPGGEPLQAEEMLARIRAQAARTGQPFMAVLNYALPQPAPGVDLLYRSPPAIVESETYWVYRVAPPP